MKNGFTWRFMGFYGEPSPINRVHSWALLRRLKDMEDLPWVCGGDFNKILCMNEKVGSSDKSILGMIRFRQTVDECDLSDLGSTGPNLNWNNRREGSGNVQVRLDRFFADFRWRDKFGQAVVEHLGFNSSDHRANLLRFKKEVKPLTMCAQSFDFELFWLKEEDLGIVVKKVWNDSGPTVLVGDLKTRLN
ncbi:hypothetical protein Ddye_006596 [Dipteronia dyeriana]|uniref:Reverse transcriptase n=1 Tax=Dipteronia dyeriana TaxID=168575 RepID=A0AAD9XIR0_9ROSI|nr:hypothetical protein Ddye_006596 [Dipteronia dyeriana]